MSVNLKLTGPVSLNIWLIFLIPVKYLLIFDVNSSLIKLLLHERWPKILEDEHDTRLEIAR